MWVDEPDGLHAEESPEAWGFSRAHRGTVYAWMGKERKAIREYGKALRIAPDFAEVYRLRAELYEELGERENADADYDKCAEIRKLLEGK